MKVEQKWKDLVKTIDRFIFSFYDHLDRIISPFYAKGAGMAQESLDHAYEWMEERGLTI